MGHTVDLPSYEKSPSAIDSRKDGVNTTKGNFRISKPSQSDTPIKYGVSPAKVAQVERQSSTESEESSHSSEEDQPGVERSRSLIRSASPRRSASPMRRIQIGRSGSRRSTALTVKSLSYFPTRERTVSHRDATADSSEEEGSDQPPKKSETNVQRISVQDAINLFESKRRDQTSDIQKRSTLDASCTNKSVLRRWSAGVAENSTQLFPETVSENSVAITSDSLEGREIPKGSAEAKLESDVVSIDHNSVETAEVDANLDTSEKMMSYPIGSQADNLVTQSEDDTEKLIASSEWNQQKEVELNQMLIKMMESKSSRYRNTGTENKRSQDVTHELKGGFYDHYKEKREENLRGETAGKQAEKQAQFRAMQQILDKRKAEMASDVVRKNSLAKPQKSHKSFAQCANPLKESSKPAVVKKALSKASSTSAAIRKSWPSTPSPRITGTSPAKTPCGTSSTGPTPTLQKPQSASSVPRSTPKVEMPQQRTKNVKASQNDTSKSTNGATEKLQPLAKNGKTAKAKVQKKTTGNDLSVVAAKPSLYSKVTKKSTVVPLESKTFLRKRSGLGPSVGPVVVKAKVSYQLEEILGNLGNQTQSCENEVVTDSSDPVNQQQEGNLEAPETHTDLESEPQVTIQKCDDPGTFEQVTSSGDDSFIREAKPVLKTEIEEVSDISPTAWVEIEEHQDLLPVPHEERTCQITSSSNVTPIEMSYLRIRHSLSQMLLEESAEAEIMEWGNAENPPAMVYQKDAPKGLKRLLKFARKSWAEPNVTGCSSSSVFYEGEDDAEESKTVGKKNADHLLRKDAVYAKNYGQQKSSCGGYEKSSAGRELLSAQSNMGKVSAQSSHKWQDHISAAATTTKGATRSFFSLSAFRGSKPNDTKLH